MMRAALVIAVVMTTAIKPPCTALRHVGSKLWHVDEELDKELQLPKLTMPLCALLVSNFS